MSQVLAEMVKEAGGSFQVPTEVTLVKLQRIDNALLALMDYATPRFHSPCFCNTEKGAYVLELLHLEKTLEQETHHATLRSLMRRHASITDYTVQPVADYTVQPVEPVH